jgi:integrating conjugative element protein (TIGR03761 family)
MTLHTRDAYWLFIGRPAQPENHRPRIIGGQRIAAVLNALRHMSMDDNPYADWILVRFYDDLVALRAHLAAIVQEHTDAIEQLQRKGITLYVLGSRNPLLVTVAFGSTYGYAVAEAVVEFDYFVRIIKTLVLKDRMSADAGRDAVRDIARALRRLFAQAIRWEHVLMSRALRGLRRRDFLPTADELARARVHAARTRLGELPAEVLSTQTIPRHALRRKTGTDGEVPVVQRPLAARSAPANVAELDLL